MSSLGDSELELNIIGGVIMMQGKKTAAKKVAVSVNIGGRKPVQKEALVCPKTGKIIRFVEKHREIV
jgi:hypothetical protein